MKKLITCFLALAMIIPLSACSSSSSSKINSSSSAQASASQTESKTDTSSETRTITDMYGREVEIPTEIHSIVCTGSGALRIVSYLNGTGLLCGVEEADVAYETSTKRDYAHVNYADFKNLPLIGKGGGTAYTAYPEEIINAAPDVIFTCYQEEALEQLSSETNIPIVSIRYTSTDFINDSFYGAMKTAADVLGLEDRCDEVLSYIDECKDDLDTRTRDIPNSEKPTAYTGAVTFSGAHGFAGTYANFGPFMAINALNVADETGEEGSFEVDLEKVIVWNPEVIFLDPGNMNLVNDEYASNLDFFNGLSAVKSGNLYTMPSFNNYSTNITYCLMDAYYAGTVLYPEQFADINIKEKGNEILNTFLKEAYFDAMSADGLYYGKLVLGDVQ